MDLTPLTQTLAPLLPYLLKGGIELAKSAAGELGKKLSADGWEGLKKLAGKIQKKAEAKPALQEALIDAQNAPQDEDALAALRLQLKKLLQEDPGLRAEATRLLATAQSGGANAAIASGSRSVAIGGSASGNVIITGDKNAVSA